MAEQLIIWLDDDAAHWLVLDAQGNRVGFPQSGSLEQAAALAEHRRSLLLVPGEAVLDLHADIPGRNPQKILQAAPFAMEERFAAEVDDMHFVLLGKANERPQRFLAVARNTLDGWLARCSEHGIAPVAAWPDYLAVGIADERTQAVLVGSRLLVRLPDGSGFAAPASHAPALIEPDEQMAALQLLEGSEMPPGLDGSDAERLDHDTLFTRLARNAVLLPGNGLLQGEFRSRQERRPVLRRWRAVAILVGLLAFLSVVDWGLDVWRLNRENAMLTQATERLFHQALPDVQRMVSPRVQIQQRLEGSKGTASPALQLIAALGKALPQVSDAKLNGFNYRNGRMEASINAPDAATLDKLRELLESQTHFKVSIQSANAAKEGVEGRLLLEASGA